MELSSIWKYYILTIIFLVVILLKLNFPEQGFHFLCEKIVETWGKQGSEKPPKSLQKASRNHPEKTTKKHKNFEKNQTIYGLHSVKGALANEKREHVELLINENHSNLAKKYQSKVKIIRILNQKDFNKLYGAFKKLNCEIYGISKDDIKSHKKFRTKYKIKFHLLSDEEKKMIKSYKVWGKKKFMGREFMGIIRTTFLLDKKRNIIKTWKNVKVKDHAKEVLNTLKSTKAKRPHNWGLL